MKNILLFALVAILISGCVELSKKETFIVYGCTDPLSINYLEEATKDDGSCDVSRIQRVVFYSTGSWESGDETAENVILYNDNGDFRYGQIEVNKGAGERDQALCSKYEADEYKLILEIDRNETSSFKAVLEYTYYDSFLNDFITDTRDVYFSLEESQSNSCLLYNI